MSCKVEDVGTGCEGQRSIYKYTYGQGEHKQAKIFYKDDGSGEIDADGTYNEWYLKKYGLGSFAKKADNSQSEPSKKKSSSNESEGWTCAKFLWTITLILPIWWVIKLPFTMARAGYRALVNIITWPFRLLFGCCCDYSKKLFPEDLGIWPKYDFSFD